MTVGRTTAPSSSSAAASQCGLKRCVAVDASRRRRAWSRCARVVKGKAARREEEEFFRRGADAKEEEEMTTMGLPFESDETTTMTTTTTTTGFLSWTPSAMDEEYETIAARLETRVDEAFGALEERAKRLRERRKRTASTIGNDERLVMDAIIDARVRSGAETETTASVRMNSAGDAGRGDYGETTTTTAALEEAKFELEKKMDEVREEMRAVREMKRALESEQGATRGKIEDLQLKYLDGEATRRVLANRLRELGEDPDALAPLGGNLIDNDDDLRAERASHEATRKALAEMRMTHEASLSLAEALREEVEALRDSTSDSIGAVGPAIPLRDIQLESPLKTLDKTTATAVEAHLLWRRRCERDEPGSAETDWTRAEDLLKDRIARKDGRQLIYWTFLRSVSELLHRGDVAALDDKALAILGDFVARVVVAAEIARADTDA